MDLSSIASGLAASSVSQGVDIGVLKAVQGLDQAQSAILLASIGIGGNVNTLA